MYDVVKNHVRKVLLFMEQDLLVDTACDLFSVNLNTPSMGTAPPILTRQGKFQTTL